MLACALPCTNNHAAEDSPYPQSLPASQEMVSAERMVHTMSGEARRCCPRDRTWRNCPPLVLLLNSEFFWTENFCISCVSELVLCLCAVTHPSPLSQQCVMGLLSQDVTPSMNGLCLVTGFGRRQLLFYKCLN